MDTPDVLKQKSVATRAVVSLGVALAWLAAMVVPGLAAPADPSSKPKLIVPRVVGGAVDKFSPTQVDIALTLAVRASRDLTIRSLTFGESSVEDVPVWIAPVTGNWRVRAGEELEIPEKVIVTAQTRDLLDARDLVATLDRGRLRVRTTAELVVTTPWLSRLFFAPSTRTAMDDVRLEVALPAAAAALRPLVLAGGSGLLAAAQRFLPGVGGASGREPQQVMQRFGRRVVPLTTTYTIASAGEPGQSRRVDALGVLWTPSVVCTTREAIEPWRFDFGDSIALQVGNARVSDADIRLTLPDRPISIEVDALPKVASRAVYASVNGSTHRIRLVPRASASTVVCLRMNDDSSAAPTQAASPEGTVAAFARGTAMSVVWTDVRPGSDGLLALVTPVHRVSYGSPMVAGDQVVGTAPYINSPTGRLNQTGSVYYGAVPLDAGKTVHAIRLPATGASPGPGLHVFAVAIS